MRFINFVGVTIFIMSFSTFSQNVSEYSKEYTDCISKTVNNPMSTECIDSEINAQNKSIDSFIGKHGDITSPEDGNIVELKLFTDNQRKYIDGKCDLWLKTGGQNGMLLNKQCVLDETISLKKLLSDFVSSVDG
ncbi:hypothetical protein JYY36_004073 [Salmonella enterica subsp. diarizonae serovar 50:z:-]|nr:hypothetical protein [Salmonella enterica]EDC7491894.1 hypothetical protein [Salmonella enterica]EHC2387843.1 hypothetical protein [Salmonella enterica]EHC9776777.1 hypothetical protein [Salmonella enterica subsp. diarizonae serovar 50:z:-]